MFNLLGSVKSSVDLEGCKKSVDRLGVFCEEHNMKRYTIHVRKPYTRWAIKTIEERKMGNIYEAIGAMLKPVKSDLTEIKTKLDAVSIGIDDLRTRIEEIEKILKEQKVKVA